MPGPYKALHRDRGTAAHHTRQALALTMTWPALQEYAFWNSGMFSTVPFTR
jgi:hypothetical protein